MGEVCRLADKSIPLDVVIVEDSEIDTKRVLRELRRSGFSPQWERVETTPALREALQRRTWHLVIAGSSVARLAALDALAVSKDLAPQLPFIVVSGTMTVETAVEAMRLGAADYVTKRHLGRLGPAVAREVGQRGRRPPYRVFAVQDAEQRRIAREILTKLRLAHDALEALVGGLGGGDADCPFGKLTTRQREVLQLIAGGHSTKEISSRLQISPKTVETHRSQLMERLDIHHVAGLVHYAIRAGIVPVAQAVVASRGQGR